MSANGLIQKNNSLFALLNTYNSSLVLSLNKLLFSYGISGGCTEAQILQLQSDIGIALTVEQKASLMAAFNESQLSGLSTEALSNIYAVLGGVLVAMSSQAPGKRTFESDLASMGYADAATAIADTGTYFTGQTRISIENTLTRVAELLVLLDGLYSVAAPSLGNIVVLKNKVAEVADSITQVS